MMSRKSRSMYWVLKLVPVIIMLQSLFFKFSGAEESVHIFSKIGMEPWGRIITGIAELVACILIIIPSTTIFGSLLGLVIMGAALFFHFTKLGIVIMDDSGLLFLYAWIVFISCLVLTLIIRRPFLPLLKK